MKNKILVFFIVVFVGQVVVCGESQDALMKMVPYFENFELENIAYVDLSAHKKALEIAAEEHNEDRFKALLFNQGLEQKKESLEYFKKMSGRVVPLKLEEKDANGIDNFLLNWIDGDKIKQCMAYYRGEIHNEMLSQKIRTAINLYTGQPSDESRKKTIEEYAFVKSIQKDSSGDAQMSPFEWAINQYCNRSLSLLLELTQGKAAQHYQWDNIKQNCKFLRVELFLQYNLIDLVVNIFCEQARSAGRENFIVYDNENFNSARRSLSIYLEGKTYDENILQKTDENGNTLLHAAVCFQSEELVNALLTKGAKVETQNKEGNTVLHEAWIRANGLLRTVIANNIHESHIKKANVDLEKMHRIINCLREKVSSSIDKIKNNEEKTLVDLCVEHENLKGQFVDRKCLLSAAAENNNAEEFQRLLMEQSEEQKQKSIELFKKMSGYIAFLDPEKQKAKTIDDTLLSWIESDKIQECMAYYRGEISNNMVSTEIRDAIGLYTHNQANASNMEVIKKYAFVKSMRKNQKNDEQISPFEYAINRGNFDSLSLLLELTKGKAAQHCQWNDIKQKCTFSQVGLFLYHNLIDFVVNIFCTQASRAGTHGMGRFVAYNAPSNFAFARGALIIYFGCENYDESILQKTDENSNTLLHAAVCLQDEELVNALLKKGAKVEAQNKEGNTVLHEAWIRANGLLKTIIANDIHESYIKTANIALEKMHRIILCLQEMAEPGTGTIENNHKKRVIGLGQEYEGLKKQLTEKADESKKQKEALVWQQQGNCNKSTKEADRLVKDLNELIEKLTELPSGQQKDNKEQQEMDEDFQAQQKKKLAEQEGTAEAQKTAKESNCKATSFSKPILSILCVLTAAGLSYLAYYYFLYCYSHAATA